MCAKLPDHRCEKQTLLTLLDYYVIPHSNEGVKRTIRIGHVHKKRTAVTRLYRDWNSMQYGNIATLHVCTGTETVCSTVTLQHYMFVQGLELSAVR